MFADEKERNGLVRKWRLIGALLFAVTVSLHATWERMGSVCFAEKPVGNASQPINQSFAEPLINIRLLPEFDSYYLGWYAQTTVFILSQQLLGCAIILSLILKELVDKINADIDCFREEISRCVHRDSRTSPSTETVLFGDVKRQIAHRFSVIDGKCKKLLQFGGDLNVFFGTLLLAMYGLDLATCIGYVASLMASVNTSQACLLHNYTSIVVFGAYATVFLMPLVLAYEEVMRWVF